jgi:Spx/MgsR family transcriptional regulator
MLTQVCLDTENDLGRRGWNTTSEHDTELPRRHSNFGVFMPKAKIQFLQKPTCTTCRKAKAYLEALGAELELRSLDKQRLSKDELDQLIGDRDYRQFLSTRNELYRTRRMKDYPPTRAQAIALMAEEPNLIRRPLVIRGKRLVLGYDELAYKDIVK